MSHLSGKKDGQRQRILLPCPKSACYSVGVKHFAENKPTFQILPEQELLRPALPKVLGCVDYLHLERELKRMDQIILTSGIESLFVALSKERYEAQARENGTKPSAKALHRHQLSSRQALRCTILKQLLDHPFRELSVHLAESALMQWFCRIENFGEVRVPSKSTLQVYGQWLEDEQMKMILAQLKEAASGTALDGSSVIGLANALELDVVWVDSTALPAHIHMPVDWVLLRDGARTLVKAIVLIRKHGLKHRMPEPLEFLSLMNQLCIAMSATRRRTDCKKQRKAVLRQMKRLIKVITEHAERYHRVLDENWAQTDWSRPQAEQVLRRIAGVLEQMPAAVKQAHERIIGERKVSSKEKILSLYEPDIHVIVRGKAGAEVEFGNSLFVAEQSDGYILDHDLRQDVAPGDAKWLEERLSKIAEDGDPTNLSGLFADRGFASKRNEEILAEHGIFNGLCPRNPKKLEERLGEEEFGAGQKRRAQIEPRIAILKNVYLSEGCPRAKGFVNRQLAVDWAVLTHNLRLLARLPLAEPVAAEIAESAAA